jgi:transposase
MRRNVKRSPKRSPKVTIGLDLGDRSSRTCEFESETARPRYATVPTTHDGIVKYFGGRPRSLVVLEVGTHSPWISRLLEEQLGHEVVVGNPSAMYGKRRRNRNDDSDAEYLARQGRADKELLHPIKHRGAQAQLDLAIIRARDQVVRSRTKLINHVRGAVKSTGARIGRCSAESFARKAGSQLPEQLKPVLQPLLDLIATLSKQIAAYEAQIETVVMERYPEASYPQQVKGVGALTALAFVLLIEDPKRFKHSRAVGPYLGLVPRQDESSDSQPQLRITKSGDELGRRLLVSAAQYIMGPFGEDCDLRRHGQAIALRGGKNAKKRAVVAVARKLAVLMHRLWVTKATYDPNHQLKRRAS